MTELSRMWYQSSTSIVMRVCIVHALPLRRIRLTGRETPRASVSAIDPTAAADPSQKPTDAPPGPDLVVAGFLYAANRWWVVRSYGCVHRTEARICEMRDDPPHRQGQQSFASMLRVRIASAAPDPMLALQTEHLAIDSRRNCCEEEG